MTVTVIVNGERLQRVLSRVTRKDNATFGYVSLNGKRTRVQRAYRKKLFTLA